MSLMAASRDLSQTRCQCGGGTFNVALYVEVAISSRTRSGMRLVDSDVSPHDLIEVWCAQCGAQQTNLHPCRTERFAFVTAAITQLLRTMVPVQARHLSDR